MGGAPDCYQIEDCANALTSAVGPAAHGEQDLPLGGKLAGLAHCVGVDAPSVASKLQLRVRYPRAGFGCLDEVTERAHAAPPAAASRCFIHSMRESWVMYRRVPTV